MRILIIGCGYLGLRAAHQWHQDGHEIAALTRSPERAAEWKTQGISPLVGDVMQPASLESIPEADLCLYAVGFDRAGPHDKRAVYVEGLNNALQVIALRIPKLIFISSTSVYGQSAGEWVDEDSPCTPESAGGKICLEAEHRVREFFPPDQSDRGGAILRLAGIYGPGRLIGRRDQLLQGTPIEASPDAWLNLIHVADAVAAVRVMAAREVSSRTWLLSDEHPLQRREFYSLLADLVGAPAPTFTGGSDGLNKRCDSRRIRAAYDLQLTFPSAREGLPAALQQEDRG